MRNLSLSMEVGHPWNSDWLIIVSRNGMTRLEDIHPGNLLTGRVSNVTAFGAFVDIGELKNVFFKLSFQFHGF